MTVPKNVRRLADDPGFEELRVLAGAEFDRRFRVLSRKLLEQEGVSEQERAHLKGWQEGINWVLRFPDREDTSRDLPVIGLGRKTDDGGADAA